MSDETNPSSDSQESSKANPGCLTQWVGLLIMFAPAIFGQISVSAECGAWANESNCGAYMWPMLLVFSIPMGLIVIAAGRSTARNSKKSQQETNPPA
jgi:hypothetical protein